MRKERSRYRAALLGLALAAAASTPAARGQVITEFPVTSNLSYPLAITSGPDGNLWFVEQRISKIGRMTLSGVVTEFDLPAATCVQFSDGCSPTGIGAGPDGNLWFTEFNTNKIGRITTAGTITEFPIPTAQSGPGNILTGPDGNLWFNEAVSGKIARMTTSGSCTEFTIPTAASQPVGMTVGPDANIWFTEYNANKIGRITTNGTITEFPIPTAGSPQEITSGPDGNLWFGDSLHGDIGRITTAGDVTKFTIPSVPSAPIGIVAGPDGNLWFVEAQGIRIGRITTSGTITEFHIPTASSVPYGIVVGSDGNLWFTEKFGNNIGVVRQPPPLAVDANTTSGDSSNHNGVLEPGETVQVTPAWTNGLADSQTFTGTASDLAGPAGPTYTIDDASADYGTVPGAVTTDCFYATGDCYLMTVAGTRPLQHWDVTFTETLSGFTATPTRWAEGAVVKVWTLHVGESFPDVPASGAFYKYVENLFHNGVTGGCGGGNYCPGASVTRGQMAVFLLKGEHGTGYAPPACSSTVFADEPCPGGMFVDWVNQLAAEGITGGCGGGNYCPTSSVLRQQMAVFLLKAEHGSSYAPPACTGIFGDVACPSQFADWIENLAAEAVTGGCGGGNYCPGTQVTRGQMAVFLVKTFALLLYGP